MRVFPFHGIFCRAPLHFLPGVFCRESLLVAHQPVVRGHVPVPERGDLELIAFGGHEYPFHLAEVVVIIEESDQTGACAISFLQRRPGFYSEVGEVHRVGTGKSFEIDVDTIVHRFGGLIQPHDEFSMLRLFAVFGHRLFFDMRPGLGVLPGRWQDGFGGVDAKGSLLETRWL